MNTIACLEAAHLDKLAQLLGEWTTGSQISRLLKDCELVDESDQSTKWRRLAWAFRFSQEQHKCANRVLEFARQVLAPVAYVGREDQFEERRQQLNLVLGFAGLQYGADGQLHPQGVTTTLAQAEARVRTIRAKLHGRQIHPEVLKYCRTELMQDNYFHAVFEAAKGLEQRLREMSGVNASGAVLVDRVFAVDNPLFALNSLRTETEKSEHKGFAALLKGCFMGVRNPLAHEPKILWDGEDDAADYFSLISLLHRRLDQCVTTKPVTQL